MCSKKIGIIRENFEKYFGKSFEVPFISCTFANISHADSCRMHE